MCLLLSEVTQNVFLKSLCKYVYLKGIKLLKREINLQIYKYSIQIITKKYLENNIPSIFRIEMIHVQFY